MARVDIRDCTDYNDAPKSKSSRVHITLAGSYITIRIAETNNKCLCRSIDCACGKLEYILPGLDIELVVIVHE
jgi:hypothetical protein